MFLAALRAFLKQFWGRRPPLVEQQGAGDPNMALAYLFAEHLGRAPDLPVSLRDVDRRAELVDAVDGSFITGSSLPEVLARLADRLRSVAEITRESLPDPDIPDGLTRVNVTLRLWAGCISAAKTIASETRSGANTPELRASIFAEIDSIADRDAIYRAGVEAAPAFKRLRKQPWSLDGVPARSPVRTRAGPDK